MFLLYHTKNVLKRTKNFELRNDYGIIEQTIVKKRGDRLERANFEII